MFLARPVCAHTPLLLQPDRISFFLLFPARWCSFLTLNHKELLESGDFWFTVRVNILAWLMNIDFGGKSTAENEITGFSPNS